MNELIGIYMGCIILWMAVLNHLLFKHMVRGEQIPAYIGYDIIILSYFLSPILLFAYTIMLFIGFFSRKVNKVKNTMEDFEEWE